MWPRYINGFEFSMAAHSSTKPSRVTDETAPTHAAMRNATTKMLAIAIATRCTDEREQSALSFRRKGDSDTREGISELNADLCYQRRQELDRDISTISKRECEV